MDSVQLSGNKPWINTTVKKVLQENEQRIHPHISSSHQWRHQELPFTRFWLTDNHQHSFFRERSIKETVTIILECIIFFCVYVFLKYRFKMIKPKEVMLFDGCVFLLWTLCTVPQNIFWSLTDSISSFKNASLNSFFFLYRIFLCSLLTF